ncbi:MAG: hypothetical protein QOF76_5091 [Solirubrobacteraceae bacterium]|jgi:hypothetical protein|nr:hypothetical protein [Solirubrobacteraceae bacterium]
MPADVITELWAFKNKLDELGDPLLVPWRAASVYNALLERAQAESTGDPVIERMEPLRQSYVAYNSTTDVRLLRVLTAQLIDEVEAVRVSERQLLHHAGR